MRRGIAALAAVLIAALQVTPACRDDDGADSDGRAETEDGGDGY